MKEPIKLPKMGKVTGAVIIVIWAFTILFFLRLNQIYAKYVGAASNLGPIFPVTILSAIGTFIFAAYMTRRGGPLSALGNGFLGFIAGPMIFEFPYVLIIIPLVKAPIVPVIIYLVPLFTIIITTLSLLLLSRRIALTNKSVYALAAMIFVFALWALDGYSYPTTPLAIALNSISKILGFVCVALLFVPKSPAVQEAPARGEKIGSKEAKPEKMSNS